MQIDTKQLDGGLTLVEVSGRIVLGRDSQRLEWQIEELLGKGQKQIVLDIAKVDYVDSAGLGILVGCSGKAKEAGGSLRIAGAAERVASIFKMTGLDHVLSLYKDAAAAQSA